MSWFKLDDKSWGNAKVVDVGNAAWGAMCRMGAYASDHLTDGVIPASIVVLIASVEETDRLVSAGMLMRSTNGSFEIHDYLQYNPSAKEVRKIRKSRSESGRIGGTKRQANARRLLDTCLPSASAEFKQVSTPSRPVPIPEERETRESAPSVRTLSQGERHDAAEVYQAEAGALSSTGAWGYSTIGERNIVASAVATHAPKGAGAEGVAARRAWIASKLREWVSKDSLALTNGLMPIKFADWLRAGCPKRESGKGRFTNEAAVIPPPPALSKQQLGEREAWERDRMSPDQAMQISVNDIFAPKKAAAE